MSANSPKTEIQMKKTRSISSSSEKSTSVSDVSAPPFSSAEFRKIIAGLQKTQNETLSHRESLSSSLSSKFNELKASVDSLSTQIVKLKSENASL